MATNNSCWVAILSKISWNPIASMFFDGFSSKTNHLLRANISYCYEQIITISPKLATLASGQILTHFLMIHRYTHRQTHTHTHRRKRYQYTWKISSCHVITTMLFSDNRTTLVAKNRHTGISFGRSNRVLRKATTVFAGWKHRQEPCHCVLTNCAETGRCLNVCSATTDTETSAMYNVA